MLKARYGLPLLMAGLVYLFFSTYNTVKKRAMDDFNAQQMVVVKQAATGIESFFNFYQQEMDFLGRIPVVAQMDSRGRGLLDIFYQGHADKIKAVTRMDSTGRIVYTTPYSPGAIGRDISDQPHVQAMLKERRSVVSDVFTAVQGYSAVAYLIPVFQDSTFMGSLTVLIPFDAMASHYLQNIRVGENGYAWMISQSGIMLYHPVSALIGQSVEAMAAGFPALQHLTQRMLKEEEGYGDYVFSREELLDGRRIDKHAVFASVHLGKTLWSIAVATPSREVAVTLRGFRNRLGFIALLFLSVGIYFFAMLIKTHAVLGEVRKRQKAEQALFESEQRFRSYVEHSPLGVFVTDEKGYFLEVNPAACLMSGYDENTLLGKNLLDMVPPEGKVHAAYHFQTTGHSGYMMDDSEVVRRDGSHRLWRITGMKLSATRLLAFADDITEQQKAEKEIRQNLREKEVLLKEIHHRVKNNMNVITSLLNLQAREIPGNGRAETALKESVHRVRSMALVHEQLYQAADLSHIPFRDYIQTLVEELLHIYAAQSRIDVAYRVEDINLSVNLAIPCGLILNELISNALKHAYPHGGQGHIEVAFIRNPDQYQFTVRDDGVGLPESVQIESAESLGLHLVCILIEQLGGTFTVARDHGTTIQITFPGEDHA